MGHGAEDATHGHLDLSDSPRNPVAVLLLYSSSVVSYTERIGVSSPVGHTYLVWLAAVKSSPTSRWMFAVHGCRAGVASAVTTQTLLVKVGKPSHAIGLGRETSTRPEGIGWCRT